MGKSGFGKVWNRLGTGARRLTVIVALFGLGVAPASATVQDATLSPGTEIIETDLGGYVLDRVRQVRLLKETRARVEIRGFCYSSCTMLLGLPNICVLPQTIFGFHGPSRSGAALPPEVFETASEVIARYYPAPLREWYLTTGRYEMRSILRVSGRRMIDGGVAQCTDARPRGISPGPI